MNSISEPFVRRPVLTVLLTLAAILFGVMAYRTLPVNDLPAVDYPVIQVLVAYPGASPETMANNVATPLEKQFMQISGLDLITSKSTQGFCSLTLQFTLAKSIDAAATDVQTAISAAGGSLPVDLPSPPTFSKTNPNDQPIMYVALVSDSVTQARLYDFASTNVGQRISTLSGVSRVDVYGTKSAIRIKADPSALAARQLTIDDLAAAVRNQSVYSGVGQIDGANRSFLLNPDTQVVSAADYDSLVVGTRNGTPVFLKDVAVARQSVQDERISMRFWTRGSETPSATVIVAVSRQAGSNAVEVAQAVRALLPAIALELPASIAIVPVYDRSQTIVDSVQDVKTTLFIAFILVVAVIFVFLGRAADTLIPVVALPLSILLTFLAMRWLGYSLDNLSLMALTLAVGFLVDDAIVFLENTVRRMEHGESALVATVHSAREISFTILSMTISLAAVFLPLVFMPGLIGRIFHEFAVTIIIAIVASGLVSLTLTPLMCSRLLRGRGPGSRKTLLERLIGGVEHRVLALYGRSLWFFLHHRWVSAPHLAPLPRRHLLVLPARPAPLPPHRRLRLHPRTLPRPGRLLPRADAPLPERRRSPAPQRPRRPNHLHHDRQRPVPLRLRRHHPRLPRSPTTSAPPSRTSPDSSWPRPAPPPASCLPQPQPRPPDLRRRRLPAPGPVFLRPLRRQPPGSLRRRRPPHGQVPPL